MPFFSIIHSYHRSFQHHSILDVSREKPIENIRRAYFAGPVGNLPNLYNQDFVISSEKLIEKMGGITSLVVDRCLTEQRPYVLNRSRHESIFNMRRINQLCLNLAVYRPEPYFLYDYDFMWSFLHCFSSSISYRYTSSIYLQSISTMSKEFNASLVEKRCTSIH